MRLNGDVLLQGALAAGTVELFKDESGTERVRLTPAGMKLAGVDPAEIRAVVEAEKIAGRPYTGEQLAALDPAV